MPCTKPGCTMNTSGPTTPSRIALTMERDELISTARRPVATDDIVCASVEVVAEAHAAPARTPERLLVEAERAGEVERVDEVFLVGEVVDPGGEFPVVPRVRQACVADRVAVLLRDGHVLDVVVHRILVG